MPSPEQRERIRSQFEVVFVPYFFVRVDCSRGAKYGQSQWQYDHWKARDPKRGVTRHKHYSIEVRWKSADKYRASQTFHRWARDNGRYLDHLTTIDVSFVASWKQRSRYGNSHVLGVNDGPQPGPMRGRNDFPQAAHKLAAIQREQGRVVPYIVKRLRERHRHIQCTIAIRS